MFKGPKHASSYSDIPLQKQVDRDLFLDLPQADIHIYELQVIRTAGNFLLMQQVKHILETP